MWHLHDLPGDHRVAGYPLRRPVEEADHIHAVGGYDHRFVGDMSEGALEDRINDCFERSMNGKPVPRESEEMRAMLAYIWWLSSGVLEVHDARRGQAHGL